MRAAVVVFVLCLAATAHAGGGVFVPPMEIDYGKATTFDGATDSELLVGIHWASLSWKPTPVEIGLGYIGISRDLPIEAIGRGETHDTSVRLDGGYITMGKTIYDAHHIRTWLLARGELLHASTGEDAIGGAIRIATEVYGATVGGGGNAGLCGTFAVGFYLEAAHRDVPSELGPTGLTTGLSVRVPFLVAN